MGNAYDNASLVLTPNGYSAGKMYSATPTDGSGDFTFIRAGVAMRRNSVGLWEEAAANVARLQYPVGSGCPSWLVEPQATNTLTWSQLFAQYYVNRCTATDLGTPSIFTSGSIARFTATAADARFGKILGVLTSGLTYTVSAFFDVSEGNFAGIVDSSGNFRIFNLTTGAVVGSGIGTLSITCQSTSEGGNIRRVSFSFTATTSTNHFLAIGTSVGTLNTTNEIVAAGYFMLETGLSVTSYIPTEGSSLTRLADVPTLSGASALIGQTEGVIYWEGICEGQTDLLGINRSTTNGLYIIKAAGNLYRGSIYAGGFGIVLVDVGIKNGLTKIALAYKSGDSALFVNGVKIASNTSAFTFSGALSLVELNGNYLIGTQPQLNSNVIFKQTRISDAELIALTTL